MNESELIDLIAEINGAADAQRARLAQLYTELKARQGWRFIRFGEARLWDGFELEPAGAQFTSMELERLAWKITAYELGAGA